jgi:ABC-type proline/glycine betaine transport system ATPase subunit
MPAPAMIQVEELSKRYGRQQAVDRLSFTVEAGQICVLLGPNGAGKITSIRMLVGLSTPDGGTVRIAETPMTLGAPVLRRVGVLIDGPAFVPHLSGTANLRLLWAAGRQPWPPPGLAEALDLAGLGPAIDRKVKGYSMGMKQRLMLANALMRRPEALAAAIGFVVIASILNGQGALHAVAVILPVHYWQNSITLFDPPGAARLGPGAAVQAATILLCVVACAAILRRRDPAG